MEILTFQIRMKIIFFRFQATMMNLVSNDMQNLEIH